MGLEPKNDAGLCNFTAVCPSPELTIHCGGAYWYELGYENGCIFVSYAVSRGCFDKLLYPPLANPNLWFWSTSDPKTLDPKPHPHPSS